MKIHFLIAIIALFLQACKTTPSVRDPASQAQQDSGGGTIETIYSSRYRKPMSIKEAEAVRELPSLPFLLKGCEGTCCGKLNSLRAMKPITLYSETDEKSKPLLLINKDEVFERAEFYIKVTRLGKALRESKEIVLLSYMDEGKWFAWADRRPATLEGLDDVDDLNNGVKKDPHTESWVQIKSSSGVIGWAKLPAQGKGKDVSLDYHECAR
jgi:hypothetical protein